MGHESDDDYYRRRSDPRQCKLAPDENPFNFRKSRMKARVQKEKKMRNAREAERARKRRYNSRRDNHSDEEVEESGSTEDFQNREEHSEVVPFAAAEPLPNPSPPSEENSNESNHHMVPNGTVSASSAEVLTGQGRRQESSSSSSSDSSSEDETEDASVLSLGAEATPIHDTHHQHTQDENLEERENHVQRRESHQRQSPPETKKPPGFSTKCKIIAFFLLVLLFGGAGAFFAIRGSIAPNLSVPAKHMSTPPTFSPSSKASLPTTDPPTQELVYDAPSPEECEIVINGGRLKGEEDLRVSRYNVELDVELKGTTTVEDAINLIANATRTILIPDLVGCFGEQRIQMNHAQLRRSLQNRVTRYNPHRYAIANGNSTIRLAEGRSCEGRHGGPCFGVDVILRLAAKDEDEKQFIFQSLIIEIFGHGDNLATSVHLGASLASITLIDVKINVATDAPSEVPTSSPTLLPSKQPSAVPSLVPSKVPSINPSQNPTERPSREPTSLPSQTPSKPPTGRPTTGMPSSDPSAEPTRKPSQLPSVSTNPTVAPTVSQAPTTSFMPTRNPTARPSKEPTGIPSSAPIPTKEPTPINLDLIPVVRNPTPPPLQVIVDYEPTV